MYRKTLIALACAVISAPAFAQSSLPECPRQLILSRYQEPCRYLTPPSPRSPPIDLSVHGEPNGWNGPDYKWGQRMPDLPSTKFQLPPGPFVRGGMGGGTIGGYEWKRK
jgi:hypothetical protein